jgi:hypothetical protein
MMNERIKELAEESGMTQYVATNNKYLERFAELIVRECADVVKWTPSMFPNDAIIKNIKEHFGVKS